MSIPEALNSPLKMPSNEVTKIESRDISSGSLARLNASIVEVSINDQPYSILDSPNGTVRLPLLKDARVSVTLSGDGSD